MDINLKSRFNVGDKIQDTTTRIGGIVRHINVRITDDGSEIYYLVSDDGYGFFITEQEARPRPTKQLAKSSYTSPHYFQD